MSSAPISRPFYPRKVQGDSHERKLPTIPEEVARIVTQGPMRVHRSNKIGVDCILELVRHLQHDRLEPMLRLVNSGDLSSEDLETARSNYLDAFRKNEIPTKTFKVLEACIKNQKYLFRNEKPTPNESVKYPDIATWGRIPSQPTVDEMENIMRLLLAESISLEKINSPKSQIKISEAIKRAQEWMSNSNESDQRKFLEKVKGFWYNISFSLPIRKDNDQSKIFMLPQDLHSDDDIGDSLP